MAVAFNFPWLSFNARTESSPLATIGSAISFQVSIASLRTMACLSSTWARTSGISMIGFPASGGATSARLRLGSLA